MNKCNFLKKDIVMMVKLRLIAFKIRVSVLIPVLSVFLLTAFFSGCGCGDNKPQNVTDTNKVADVVNRVNDKTYMDSLKQHRAEQKVVARDRNQLGREMTLCAERVKAGLAADVSQDDFKAALAQDKEWKVLQDRQAVLGQDVQDVLREARETVRERLLKEKREAKASNR